MKGTVAAIALCLAPLAAFGAGGVHPLDAKTDLSDKASLQRGATLYVNFCLGCHSLQFMRYNRMGRDLGLSDEQVASNLLFSADKVTQPMNVAMRSDDAARWFGVAPPDLSVIARSRGPDWLYTYLVTFYADPNPARPFGVNNVMFRDVGMPHVLSSLQGVQRYKKGEVPADAVEVHRERLEVAGDVIKIHSAVQTESGAHASVVDTLEVEKAGSMQPGEYRRAMRDLVNFLVYAGEPAKLIRQRIGVWVLLFLAIFFVVSRALYKDYWKDVH